MSGVPQVTQDSGVAAVWIQVGGQPRDMVLPSDRWALPQVFVENLHLANKRPIWINCNSREIQEDWFQLWSTKVSCFFLQVMKNAKKPQILLHAISLESKLKFPKLSQSRTLYVSLFYLRDWDTVSLWHLDSTLDPKSGSFQYSGCKIGFELDVSYGFRTGWGYAMGLLGHQLNMVHAILQHQHQFKQCPFQLCHPWWARGTVPWGT